MIWLFACAAPTPPTPVETGPPAVVALSEPAAWMVEQLAGEHVALTRFTPAGEDPPHWRPEPEAISTLAEADLVVGNGAGYEAWTAQANLPAVVWLAEGATLLERESQPHQHGSEGAHSHGATDPHTFGDPELMAGAACRVGAALAEVDPDGAHKNCEDLQRQLMALSEAQAEALAHWKGHTLAANHPSYGYLARRHGFTVVSLDLDPDTPSEVEGPVPGAVLWWESDPDPAWAKRLPGVVQRVVDPLEQARGERYDYLSQAEANLEVFRALPAPGPAPAP